MITILSSSEARDLLRQSRLARLGCIVDGEPYVVPINYYLDGDYAYIHSLPGRKVEALRANPRACLQVDDIRDEVVWRSALAYGTCEEIKSQDERALVLNAFYERFPLLTPVEAAIAQDATPPVVIVFRIQISTISGIKEG
ncbi:MAG: pyridoxamine 5'-phosphate oxidase family protein [Pyrinomonadaceae bacterium]